MAVLKTTHVWLAIGLTSIYLLRLDGFQLLQPSATKWNQRNRIPSKAANEIVTTPLSILHKQQSAAADRSIRLYNKLWNRMDIEEDEEPFWYLINCVAGLEMDLLRQCRAVCQGMPDALKFVVPTETKTRSHGANRMVTETKVKYQGYVFGKLRLCPEVYEAIQSLDLCRSWMGTVNHQGYRKLPPSPLALNELEVESFGLEDLEFEEEEKERLPEGEKEIIVDDAGGYKVDQEALKAFLGIKVEDMVKVTKTCKFFNEDGIVRRLKDGKILVRFYTYGSMFEEWMDPEDVRKLNDVEVLKGLSGPSQPVTQRDFDGPQDTFGTPTKGRHAARSFGGDLMSNVKGARGPRNRRQDRMERGQTNRRDFEDPRRERENWEWYNEERRGNEGAVSDNEWSYRPGTRPNDAMGDADAQWGRPSKRQQSRERKGAKQKRNNNNDWSAFVSPASAPAGKGEDDFFRSLMTDLSRDLPTPDASASSSGAAAEEDDFFKSLMAEISTEDENKKSKKKKEMGSSLYVDEFFASLEANSDDSTQSTKGPSKKGSFDEDDLFDSFDIVADGGEESDDFFKALDSGLKSTTGDGGEDFFASLEKELGSNDGKSEERSELTSSTDDDFFGSLEQELGSALETEKTSEGASEGKGGDFFASLGETLSSELDMGEGETSEETGRGQIGKSTVTEMAVVSDATSSASAENSEDLSKLTVPKLKEMLRERGMKVSGKKAELIERLRG